MCVGNVLALWQTNVPRLLAYSSIAHGGYMLVGLALGHASGSLAGGTESLLFYLAVYGLMTVGAFSVLIYLSRPERPVEMIDDLAGLGRSQPGAALLLAVFLFSLTGLPPTAGFFGKLNLLLAAWSGGTFAARSLAVVMALNAAIGAAYYLRIIGAMYLRPATAPIAKPAELPALVGSLLCAAGTLAIFFAPQWLWHVVAGISV
jgi:NADH-quinone oxidoreductase subunit N